MEGCRRVGVECLNEAIPNPKIPLTAASPNPEHFQASLAENCDPRGHTGQGAIKGRIQAGKRGGLSFGSRDSPAGTLPRYPSRDRPSRALLRDSPLLSVVHPSRNLIWETFKWKPYFEICNEWQRRARRVLIERKKKKKKGGGLVGGKADSTRWMAN